MPVAGLILVAVRGARAPGVNALTNLACPIAYCLAVGTNPTGGGVVASNVALNPPSDTMLLPADGTTQSGKVTLDSAASDNVAVSSVSYIATGGPDNGTVVSAGCPSLYGWLGQWNTMSVPNGTYTLESSPPTPTG